jgi:ComF family protein
MGRALVFSTPLRRLIDAASSLGTLLFPRECAACPSPAAMGSSFCPACGEPIPYPDGDLKGVPLLSAGRYAPPLSKAVARIKFEDRPDLVGPLARLLLSGLHRHGLTSEDAFVPVPLHRSRLVERGYNQSALLARALARATGASFVPQLLERTRRTEQQAQLGREARCHNVASAFVARASWRRGRVVLVDDVVTTGATALACIEALERAESEPIAVVALARAAG